jgi:hypothetical protein
MSRSSSPSSIPSGQPTRNANDGPYAVPTSYPSDTEHTLNPATGQYSGAIEQTGYYPTGHTNYGQEQTHHMRHWSEQTNIRNIYDGQPYSQEEKDAYEQYHRDQDFQNSNPREHFPTNRYSVSGPQADKNVCIRDIFAHKGYDRGVVEGESFKYFMNDSGRTTTLSVTDEEGAFKHYFITETAEKSTLIPCDENYLPSLEGSAGNELTTEQVEALKERISAIVPQRQAAANHAVPSVNHHAPTVQSVTPTSDSFQPYSNQAVPSGIYEPSVPPTSDSFQPYTAVPTVNPTSQPTVNPTSQPTSQSERPSSSVGQTRLDTGNVFSNLRSEEAAKKYVKTL